MAAIAFDAGTQLTILATNSSGSVNHTCASGATIWAAVRISSVRTLSTITYDSVSLTSFNTYGSWTVYRLTTPTTGLSKSFAITMSGALAGTEFVEVAIWSTTGGDGTVNATGATTSGSSITINITPTIYSLLIAVAYGSAISGPTVTGGATMFASGNRVAGTDEYRGSYKLASAGAQTMTFAQSGGGQWDSCFAIALSTTNTAVTVSDTTSTSDSELGNLSGLNSETLSLVESVTATADPNTWRKQTRSTDSWTNQTRH